MVSCKAGYSVLLSLVDTLLLTPLSIFYLFRKGPKMKKVLVLSLTFLFALGFVVAQETGSDTTGGVSGGEVEASELSPGLMTGGEVEDADLSTQVTGGATGGASGGMAGGGATGGMSGGASVDALAGGLNDVSGGDLSGGDATSVVGQMSGGVSGGAMTGGAITGGAITGGAMSGGESSGEMTGGMSGGDVSAQEVNPSLMTGGEIDEVPLTTDVTGGASGGATGGAASNLTPSTSLPNVEGLDDLRSSRTELGRIIQGLESDTSDVDAATRSDLRRIYNDLGSTLNALQARSGGDVTGGGVTGGSTTGGD